MLTYDSVERRAFRQALTAHLAAQFPTARLEWIEDGRRLLITFADAEGPCMLWEPNFFFSRGTWTEAELLDRAVVVIAGQRQRAR